MKVYHYTSLETLIAILNNSNEKGLSFRASNIFKLNDSKEMDKGFKVVRKILSEYEKSNNISEQYQLMEVYSNKQYEEMCKRQYIFSRDIVNIKQGYIPYVVCFSMHRDYLPMWSLYGKRGRGVCLVFDVETIIDDIIANEKPYGLDKIVYSRNLNNFSSMRIFTFMYEQYEKKWIAPLKNITIDDKINELADICASISPFIKYKDYSYEKEFRIIENKHYPDSPDYLSMSEEQIRDSLILSCHSLSNSCKVSPYVYIYIPQLALKEIILGPLLNETIKPSISRELSHHGIKCRIIKSKVPFCE